MPTLAALLVAAVALVSAAAPGAPLTEDAYDAEVKAWHRDWRAGKPTWTHDPDRCVASWQSADAIRTRVMAVEPPAARAEFHAALVAFFDAYLAMTDTCVGDTVPSPAWTTHVRAARDQNRSLRGIARTGRMDLPAIW